jgi:hypothetical protein
LSHQHEARSIFGFEEALHCSDGGWLIVRNVLAVQVAGGKDDEDRRDEASDDADLEKDAGVVLHPPFQKVKSAHGGHDEGAGDDGAGHVVGVLEQPPGVEQQLPEVEYLELAVGEAIIGHRVLHPGVGDDDEEARNPRSGEDHHRREPMHEFGDSFFAIEKEAEKGRLQKEAEDTFHGQRLADHAAREPREARPVGAELELHGDAGDHAEDEVDSEDAAPEACCTVPLLAAGFESDGLEHHDQKRQAHGELRKQIVECDGKGKVQAMDQFSGHRELLFQYVHGWNVARSLRRRNATRQVFAKTSRKD